MMTEALKTSSTPPIRFTIQSVLIWTAFVALVCWTTLSCRAF